MQTRKTNICIAVFTALSLAPLLAAEPQSGELLPLPKVTPLESAEEISPSLPMLGRSGALPPAPYVAPPLPAAPISPASPPAGAVLRPGEALTLRIRQVLPADGLSPGERLLNGRASVKAGDHFLAEIVKPICVPPALVGGIVTKETRPGRFGRPGYVTLQLSQIIESVDGQTGLQPWQVDLADRRTTTQMRRAMITALFGLEGAIVGASLGAQNPNSPSVGTAVAAAAGGGLLLGLGYASFQRGREANLEPGDTFDIVVGTTSFQPIPEGLQTKLYPARDPGQKKRKAQ